MIRAAVAIAIVLMCATGAGAGPLVTDAEREACHADAKRLCPHSLDSGPIVVAGCLAANRAKISKACLHVLITHGF